MRRELRVSLGSFVVFGVLGAVAVTGTLSAAAAPPPGPSITTVIPNLNTPRGITFDGRGNMYVSESGVAGAGPAGLTNTGRVSKYARGSTQPSWSTSFESVYASEDPSAPPDVLGPEGISALGLGCNLGFGFGHQGPDDQGNVQASTFGFPGLGRDGCQVRMIMSESHDGVFNQSGGSVSTTQIGHLFGLDSSSGAATDLGDVGDQMYKFTGDNSSLFPDDFPDSNPYGVLVTRDWFTGRVRTFVADAGANTIVEVMGDGTTRVIAYIPNETAPPGRDATPTCIAQGPDGMLYVATLNFVANLFVSGSGQSNVWRVDPNATFDPQHPTQPTLWATGLTTPTACTFDRLGNFWAAEMFQPNSSGPPGDVVRIPFWNPTKLTRIGGGSLPLPGGIAQGPDGAMYVTVNSSSPDPGSGAVVKIRSFPF